jgi:hypothetical protein
VDLDPSIMKQNFYQSVVYTWIPFVLLWI